MTRRCSTCRYVDKSGGKGNWKCVNTVAHGLMSSLVPREFPYVRSSDKCKLWAAEEIEEAPQITEEPLSEEVSA
jgi:hypothetical protein